MVAILFANVAAHPPPASMLVLMVNTYKHQVTRRLLIAGSFYTQLTHCTWTGGGG